MREIKNFDPHNEVTRALNAQLSAGQISHAYLFCGSEATLKEQLAGIFAEAINTLEGEEPLPEAASANAGISSSTLGQTSKNALKIPGQSPDLRSNLHGRSVDIRHYEPDSARGYLVAQIREIIADAQRAPINAPYKINIIEHAEKLTTATANAFLKTLEEPPDYVVNILLAQNTDEVLPTIVSRCQVFSLSDIPQNFAVKMVAEHSGAAPADADLFYKVANRSISKATEYLQNQQIFDLVNFCKRAYGDVCGMGTSAAGPAATGTNPADPAAIGANDAAMGASMLKISDYEVTKYSASILKGIDEITKNLSAELEDELAETQEFLDGPAIKHAEKANKRKVAALQTEMLQLVTNVFSTMAANALKNNALSQGSLQQGSPKNNEKNPQTTKRISALIEELFTLSQKLGYNIAAKNYCDVLLLKLAHA